MVSDMLSYTYSYYISLLEYPTVLAGYYCIIMDKALTLIHTDTKISVQLRGLDDAKTVSIHRIYIHQ